MIYLLSEEESIGYLEGGWEAYAVEERVLEHLCNKKSRSPWRWSCVISRPSPST